MKLLNELQMDRVTGGDDHGGMAGCASVGVGVGTALAGVAEENPGMVVGGVVGAWGSWGACFGSGGGTAGGGGDTGGSGSAGCGGGGCGF